MSSPQQKALRKATRELRLLQSTLEAIGQDHRRPAALLTHENLRKIHDRTRAITYNPKEKT